MRVCRQRELTEAHRLLLEIAPHKHCTCCPCSPRARQPSAGESQHTGPDSSSTLSISPCPRARPLNIPKDRDQSQCTREETDQSRRRAPHLEISRSRGGKKINRANSVTLNLKSFQ
jgi:hypothetical protein